MLLLCIGLVGTCTEHMNRHRAGLKEVQILNRIKQSDPDDKKHIVRLERTFEHRGHLCLVFESLRSVPHHSISAILLTEADGPCPF